MSAARLRPLLPVLVPGLLATIFGWAVFVSTFKYPGKIGLNYNAPGTDWMVLYSGIRLALTHRFALAEDGMALTSYLNSTFGHWLSEPLVYRPWFYPPGLLIILLPFGALGFVASYFAFQLASAALLAGALCYRSENQSAAPWVAAAAVLCPAASSNFLLGQCSFLIAGLLVLGFRLLPRRPLLAGAVLGLVSIKPQFGLMVPVALLAMREWRSFAGVAASALALVAISALMFGPELWVWWIGQTLKTFSDTDYHWATFNRLWGTSVYACAILLGLSAKLASLMQILAVVGSAAGVYLAYRSHLGQGRKLAVLLACAILAAPHAGFYDDVLLTVAGALWLSETPAPQLWHWIVMLVLWLSPLLGPPALMPIARVLPLFVAGFAVMLVKEGEGGPAWTRGGQGTPDPH